MSRLSESTKKRMYDLAVEIIEHKRERPDDCTGICRLYDQTDSEWEAERIKSLMDELRETQRQLTAYKARPVEAYRVCTALIPTRERAEWWAIAERHAVYPLYAGPAYEPTVFTMNEKTGQLEKKANDTTTDTADS